MSAKLGRFGKSFNEIGQAIKGRINDINNALAVTNDLSASLKNSPSVWARLFPSKESIQSQLIDVDKLYPKIDDKQFNSILSELLKVDKQVLSGGKTWQSYFSTLEEGEEWQIDFVKNTDLQKASLKDVKNSYEAARQSALNHNAALKQQTIGAKAATAATVALKTALSAIAYFAIAQALSFIITKIDEVVNAAEKCAERVDELMSTYESAISTANSNASRVETLAEKYKKLSAGVNDLGQNVSLTSDEYKEYKEYNEIVNEIADMFPRLIKGYTDEGNAILTLKGDVEGLRDAYKEAQKEAYNLLIVSGKDTDGNDIITNWNNTLHEDKGKGTNITKAIKELEAFITSDLNAETYTTLGESAQAEFYDGMTDAEKLIAGSEFLPYKIKFDLDEDGTLMDEEMGKAKAYARALLQTYNAEIESNFKNIKTLANAYLMTNEDYEQLSEQSKTIASILVNNIPATSGTATVLMSQYSKEQIGEYVDYLVQALSADNPEVQKALISSFTIDFDTLSYSDAKTAIDKYVDVIAKYLYQDPVEVKARLGFSEYDDSENLINNVKNKLQDEFDDKVGELSLTDLKIAAEQVEVGENELLSWNELKSKIEEAKRASETASKSFEHLSDVFDELYDSIDNVLSKQEKLADAFKKTQLGATLSSKEIYELIKEMPKLAEYVEKSGDGYTITQEGFKIVSQENDSTIKKQLKNDIEQNKEKIELLKEEEKLRVEMENLYQQWENTGGANKNLKNQYDEVAKEYEEVAAQCQKITDSMEDLEAGEKGFTILNDLLNESFDETKLAIEGVNEAFDNAKTEISDYNSNIQTINNAIKTLKDSSLLTYDEMNALVEISPKLQDSFEQQEDGYSIVIEALEELREESYKTRNDYIEDRIATAKTDIEAAEQTKKAYEKTIKSLKDRGAIVYSVNADYIASLEENIEGLDEEIQNLYDTINKLEGLQGVVITTDTQKEDDLSDKLQNQIDQYKTILSAVDAVKNKYSEAIDKEIDALNDGKAVLKDSNDERQRELDLIETRNNLENAKKRKVWVYSEGEGFKQVTDEKAVKEAEEDLRNVVVDIQEAEIDKRIEALEDQKEQLEENTKALTELESEIEDAKNIAQAVKALGLNNESELLNLPDDTVEEIRNGFAKATLKKDIEDNKNNESYTPVSIDELLQSLGAKVNAAEAAQILGGNNQSVYNAAVQGFKDALNKQVNNSIVNNGGTTVTNYNTFEIYDATDPDKVARIVNREMTTLFTKIGNSIK